MRFHLIAKTFVLTLLMTAPSFCRIDAQTFGNAGSKSASEKAPLKSIADLFDKLPADLRPPKEGWNLATLAKVEDWVRQNLVGRRVERHRAHLHLRVAELAGDAFRGPV